MRCGGLVLGALLAARAAAQGPAYSDEDFAQARTNGVLANEGFERCVRFVNGWLAHVDPTSGLIPRNLSEGKGYWNAQDAAADNYAFMVLTAAMADRVKFDGVMKEMLASEKRLTSRLGTLPDDYSFSKQGFRHDSPDANRISFGASEYVKDGLMPICEWLGVDNPWYGRMRQIMDDLWANQANAVSDQGMPIIRVSNDSYNNANIETQGENLQVLPRLYWQTGDKKYLEYAVRLGDHYLLGSHHPTEDLKVLSLRDHGNEIISGLAELYATLRIVDPEKAAVYRAPFYSMLDRVLELGRNPDGLFYNAIDPKAGRATSTGLADTFGYVYNAFYTAYLADKDSDNPIIRNKVKRYREAVREMLASLDRNYRDFNWDNGSADAFADAIEGALNLYNREPVEGTADWVDIATKVMWSKQQEDGVIEGWHGDGNFARTTLMYALWKTQGLTVDNWREDLRFGAVQEGGALLISLVVDEDWEGHLLFDKPRHRLNLHLPYDWTRINQFPEWFVVDPKASYVVTDIGRGTKARLSGRKLIDGLQVTLKGGAEQRFVVTRA
jgi:hypothetical protein